MPPNWFIGLPVTETDWLDGVLESAPAAMRRYRETDLHATVAFLGPCGELKAWDAWEVAKATAFPGFEGTLRGLQGMGNPRRPSAFSLLVDAPKLGDWIGAARDGMLKAADAQLDQRKPLPHVTVARPGRKSNGRALREGLAWAESLEPLDRAIRLDHLALYTWTDDRSRGYFRIVDERRRGPGIAPVYDGGCHCGAVRFRVTVRDHRALDCNCSVCAKKGLLHLIVDEGAFELVQGQDALSTYTFGTHTAKHLFCSTCGVQAFYRPRSHPDCWDVNPRCLDGDALSRFEVVPFDGANWEQNVDAIR